MSLISRSSSVLGSKRVQHPIVIALFICQLAAISSAQADLGRGTGLRFMDPAQYGEIPQATAALMGTLPDSIDMSANFPPAGDQGTQGSCVGWAVCYALKSYQERKERGWNLDDPAHVFSPAFIYNQLKSPDACHEGSFFPQALDLLKSGAATLDKFPYTADNCARRPSDAVRRGARQFAIVDWKTVSIKNASAIKAQLASGFPVVIGMQIDDAFSAIRGDTVYSAPGGRARGGHAMILVGYDDQRRAYKVMNSWGQAWGDRGFGWIGYAIAPVAITEAYVAWDQVGSHEPSPSPTDDDVDSDADADDDAVYEPAPAPAVNVLDPAITLNIPVNSVLGTQPGIQVALRGNIVNLAGRTLTIVLRFTHTDAASTPLAANPLDLVFRDAFGNVASQGTWTLGGNAVALDSVGLQIPYWAIVGWNYQPTNFQSKVQFRVFYDVYIDSFHVARSKAVDMWTLW